MYLSVKSKTNFLFIDHLSLQTNQIKPFIKRGWPNTFGNIVYTHTHTYTVEWGSLEEIMFCRFRTTQSILIYYICDQDHFIK